MSEAILEQPHSDSSPLVITLRLIFSTIELFNVNIPLIQSERAEWQAAILQRYIWQFSTEEREQME